MNKIWRIKDKNEKYSDEELITMIKNGSITKDDYIKTDDMKDYIKVEESIYQFYLEGEGNEVI